MSRNYDKNDDPSSSDELRSLRNFYYLGLYSNVLSEAKHSENPGAKVFYYLALLETSPKEVFKQINDRAATALQAVKLLGTYRTAAQDQKDLAFETLAEWLSDEMLGNDPTLQLVAAQMYFEEGNYKDALRAVSPSSEDLEKMALQVQIYLKIDRVDLAQKAAASMAEVDDDDVLTQLATSWLYIALGGEKVTEASFLLQELVDKFGPSVSVLSSQAVCQLHLGNMNEANSFLKQARSMALQQGNKVDSATLVNFIVCLQNQRKSQDIIDKIIGELKESYPTHPWLAQQEEIVKLFDRHAKTYALC